MENKATYITSVERHNVTMDEIMSFINDNVVKIVFIDKSYTAISSDKTVSEIHKFKSKYRANSYVRIPVRIVKSEDDKYVKGIETLDSEDNAQGFLVVSKHDIREMSKEMKKANAEERYKYGKQLCLDYLDRLNNMFVNNMLEVTLKNKDNTLLKKILIPRNSDINGILKDILKVMDNISTEIV